MSLKYKKGYLVSFGLILVIASLIPVKWYFIPHYTYYGKGPKYLILLKKLHLLTISICKLLIKRQKTK